MIRSGSLVVLAVVLGAGTAAAQERCEGTLCDLYYGGSAPERPVPTKPAAPVPLTVPNMPSVSGAGSYLSNMFSRSGDAASAPAAPAAAGQRAAAPQNEGFFHIGGGGVAGRGQSQCGGTICDLLHGHSSEDGSDASVSQSVNGVPQSRYSGETASAEPVAAAPTAAARADAEAAPPPEQRRVAVRAEPKPPACAGKTADPWACYRR